ncbi:hypothetical protein FKM82_031151 [Ascaphus truei]
MLIRNQVCKTDFLFALPSSQEPGRLLNYSGEKPPPQTGSIILFIWLRLQKYLVLLLESGKATSTLS